MIYHSPKELQKTKDDPGVSALSDSEVEEEFLNAANVGVRYLDPRALSDTEKLNLYAYYKQGTTGDAFEGGPSLDDRDTIRHLFWKNLKGMPRTEAQRNYITTYISLRQKTYGEDELPKIQDLLLNNIIATHHRKTWLREAHEPRSLTPFKTPHFTTIYPDQLTPEMATEYASKVGIRYKHTIANRYLTDLRATRPPTPVNDAQFRFYLTGTSYSKLIFPLNTIEKSKQVPYLNLFGVSNDNDNDNDGGDVYIMDTTPVHALPIKPGGGFYLGPAVVCLVSSPDKSGLLPTAIAIENIDSGGQFPPLKHFPETLGTLNVVHPDHGLAWELAKLYALQGADYTLGLGRHVVLHVALMNPIALALQDALRECGNGTVHARILDEHTYLLLATNSFVLHSEYSVLWPDYKQQPYDAFCVSADLGKEDFEDLGGAFNVAKLMFSGWGDHPFFKELNDVDLLHNVDYASDLGGYRSFLRRMKEIVGSFVRGIVTVAGNDNDNDSDVETRRFIRIFRERLIAHLPEKSKVKALLRAAENDESDESDANDEWLCDVISYVICNSIEHSIDHFHAGMMAQATNPRLRKPIAFADRSRSLDHIHTRIAELNTLSDRSKYLLLNEITKKNIPVKTYGDLFFKEGGYFRDSTHGRREELVGLEREFAARMTELCAASGSDHVEFCDIATSIQF